MTASLCLFFKLTCICLIDLRLEWFKARARSMRWIEEVVLLLEEMRRVAAYCGWKANWWLERVNARPDISPELAEGLSAYAHKQASMFLDLQLRCDNDWASTREQGLKFLEQRAPDGKRLSDDSLPLDMDID